MNPKAFSVLTVCGLDELDRHSAQGVSHVLSLLDPEWPEPAALRAFDPHLRTTLYFHDAIEPAPGTVLPQKADVEAILAFGRNASDDLRHLLIHCHAGISRSTAAMAMILAQAFPHESESAIVDRLMRIRPQAWPNSRMIEFADELLARDGRLKAAVSGIYARHLANRPELAKVMRRLDRAREVDLGLAGSIWIDAEMPSDDRERAATSISALAVQDDLRGGRRYSSGIGPSVSSMLRGLAAWLPPRLGGG